MFCDLHTHSNCSDGTKKPAELITLAEQAGLAAIALCDHNTVSGLPEFLAAAEGKSIEAIPGIEFTTEHNGRELHILALYVDPAHYESIMERIGTWLQAKEQSNRDLVERLNAAGYALDYDKIKAAAGDYVNRAVIGAEMVKLGYVATVKEAFKTCLSEERGFYKPPYRLDACETIRFIKSIGAAAVLAHPFLNLDAQGLREFLPSAKAAGLDGMETRYSKFTPEETALAKAMAKEFTILESGGSDYHGENKPDIALGVGRGDLQIEYALVAPLRARAGK